MGRPTPIPPRQDRPLVRVAVAYESTPWAWALMAGLGALLILALFSLGCGGSRPSSAPVALPVQQDVELIIDWSVETEQAHEVPGGKIVHVNMNGAIDGGRYVLAVATGHLSKKLEHVPDSAIAVIAWPDGVVWSENLAPHIAKPEPWIVACVYFRQVYYCSWQDVERF